MMTPREKLALLKEGYSQDQMNEIMEGLEAGLNIFSYRNPAFLPIQMRQIRLGLLDKLQVKMYANPAFDYFQMEEIRLGLLSHVDTSLYAKPEIPYAKMRQIRKGLEYDINLVSYLKFPAGVIRQLRKARLSKVNILQYIEQGYDAQQLEQIRLALESKVDLSPYLSKEYLGISLAEMRKGLEASLDIAPYARLTLNWRQMRELRLGLLHRVDVSVYNDELYDYKQMQQIRLGLEEGLDVSTYKSLMYPAAEMQKRRLLMQKDTDGSIRQMYYQPIRQKDFKIVIQKNGMEAYLTLARRGMSFEMDQLVELLKEQGIVYGLKQQTLARICEGRYTDAPILVAKGSMPHKGNDGWYEYFFRTYVPRKPRIREDGSADYQHMEWYETVTENQKIVFYHEAKDGVDGYTVTGEPIVARRGIECPRLTGEGFHLLEDELTYVADFTGIITLEQYKLTISRQLDLEDVTTATGDIHFDGSVHVHGNVGDKVRIHATEDVVIDGFVGSAWIECGGGVLLKQGMNAGDKGFISAKKDVVSCFFENVRVYTDGDIVVHTSLKSELHAKGKITCEVTFSGGRAYAQSGFKTKELGNKAEIPTIVDIGVSEQLRKDKYVTEQGISKALKELEMFEKGKQDFIAKYPPEIRNTMDMFLKLENAIYTKNLHLQELEAKKHEIEKEYAQVEKSRVEISKTAYPGSVVLLMDNRWEANNEYNVILKMQEHQLDVVNG